MILRRTSVVKQMKVTTASLSSIIEIGDSTNINTRIKALAVQRQFELFYGDEGNFEEFPIFTMSLPKPIINEHININKYNDSSFINVHHIDVISVSASGVVHIGSSKTIDGEARIKHIRQILDE